MKSPRVLSFSGDVVSSLCPKAVNENGNNSQPYPRRLEEFHDVLAQAYELPKHFMETNILLTPSSHLMNRLQQMVLALFDYDQDPEDTSPQNTLRQGIELLVTVDNGVTAIDEVAHLTRLGIDVVVTDHHQPRGHRAD